MPPAFLAVGHLTRDLTPQRPRLGGAAAYAALAARRLGYPSAVLTAAAPQEVESLRRLGVAVHSLPAEVSTSFENRYTPGGRRQYLRDLAPPIPAEGLPQEWRRAPLVLLAPVAREVDPSIARLFAWALVAAAAQGWLRRWGEDGLVLPDPSGLPEEVLPLLRVLILSEEDAPEGRVEGWMARVVIGVLTQGERGGRLHWRGRWEDYPAFPARAMDLTGAGDVFAAAFLLRYAETGHPLEAARFASAAAALSVQAPGPEGVPWRQEVFHHLARQTGAD